MYHPEETFVQRPLTMAMKALKSTIDSNILVNPARSYSQQTGGGPTWAMREEETWIMAVALAVFSAVFAIAMQPRSGMM